MMTQQTPVEATPRDKGCYNMTQQNRRNVLTFAIAQLAAHAVGSAQAQGVQNGTDLKDLSNEASRAQLFERVVKAAVNELKRVEPQVPGQRYIPADFKFPEDAITDFKLNIPRQNSIFGIDVSHYTGNLDFKSLNDQRIKFAYAKAAQGSSFKDPSFARHWASLKAVPVDKKVLKGAYHFLSAGISGEEQARTFLAVVKANGGFDGDDMPPVVDLEWDVSQAGGQDAWRNYNADAIIKETLDWLRYVKKETGRIPMVYTARSWWRERRIPEARFAELQPCRIWIADYSRSGQATETPGVPAGSEWHLWQFSDRAKLKQGYSRGLDANIFKGTEAQFKQFATT